LKLLLCLNSKLWWQFRQIGEMALYILSFDTSRPEHDDTPSRHKVLVTLALNSQWTDCSTTHYTNSFNRDLTLFTVPTVFIYACNRNWNVFFIFYNLLPQHVSAPTGHPQVEHNISYLFMVLSMTQRIRCFVIV
jgi:hypothetical protein